jgi:hypothetical protein
LRERSEFRFVLVVLGREIFGKDGSEIAGEGFFFDLTSLFIPFIKRTFTGLKEIVGNFCSSNRAAGRRVEAGLTSIIDIICLAAASPSLVFVDCNLIFLI